MKTYFIEDKEQVENIISACSTCFVGLVDQEGNPYVIPMNFGYKDQTIYLHSAPNSQLVNIVNNNPNICVTFCLGNKLVNQHPKVACSYRMQSKSVICKGQVEFIEDALEKIKILDIIMNQYVPNKHFTYSHPAVKNVQVWKIPILKWTAKEFGAPHKGPTIL